MTARKLCQTSALIALGLLTTSADMHLQTSADPVSQRLDIKLLHESPAIFFDAPGVHFEKTLDGEVSKVDFSRVDSRFRVQFHPEEARFSRREQAASVARFTLYDDTWLLKGATRTFDRIGGVRTESQWEQGILQGPQKFYGHDGQLVSERHYDAGFPVGEWKQYYADATLASIIVFPKSKKEWKQTYHPGNPYDDSNSLLSIPYIASIQTKLTFYNQDGIKQSEADYELYYNGTDPVIAYTGRMNFFDYYGNLVRSRILNKGTGTDFLDQSTRDLKHRTVTSYADGNPFKTSAIRFPLRAPQEAPRESDTLPQ
jgi:hypothetical protein